MPKIREKAKVRAEMEVGGVSLSRRQAVWGLEQPEIPFCDLAAAGAALWLITLNPLNGQKLRLGPSCIMHSESGDEARKTVYNPCCQGWTVAVEKHTEVLI